MSAVITNFDNSFRQLSTGFSSGSLCIPVPTQLGVSVLVHSVFQF